jgi:hypothetical protein
MAEPTWRFNTTQYVCPTVPPARLKSTLDNDRFTALHSLQSRGNGGGIDADAIDRGDRNSFSF